ncbi:MAG: M36 family metallopeptidase [Armatimonadetes bacterium]|nr:M36 family metallopeptidase [Armatimonadota bacterium]
MHIVAPFSASRTLTTAPPARSASAAEAPRDSFRPAEGQEPPPPPPLPPTFQHNYYAQDSLAEQLLTAEAPRDGVQPGPTNARLQVVDNSTQEHAGFDQQGNMVYPPSDPRFTQVQAFIAADRADKFFHQHLGRQTEWAFGAPQIQIKPDDGDMLNAYYARMEGSVNFFHHPNPAMNKTVSSGQSAEVVYHELGHALLDSLRPDWLSSFSDATGGMHEGFGDILSILVGLNDPRNLDKIIAETGGDLKKQNSIGRLAEELGRSIWDERGRQRPHHDYLRNAVNSLQNADPETLPWNPPEEDKLGREPHNYSRVISAAVYDVLASLNDQFQAQGFGVRESIEKARDVTAGLVMRGLEFSPTGDLPSYGHFLAGMLQADATDHGGKFTDTVRNKFAARNIHPPAPEQPPQQPPKQGEPIRISEYAKSPLGARLFLESYREPLGIGQLPLEFRTSHSNDRGETFLVFDYTKDVPVKLEGEGVQEAVVKAKGGLVLGFAKDKALFFSNLNEVTPDKEQQIRSAVEAQQKAGRVSHGSIFQSEPGRESLFKSQHVPFASYVAMENGQVVLKKSPIID